MTTVEEYKAAQNRLWRDLQEISPSTARYEAAARSHHRASVETRLAMAELAMAKMAAEIKADERWLAYCQTKEAQLWALV